MQISKQIQKRNNNKSYIITDESVFEGSNKRMVVKDEVQYQNILLSRVQPVILELLKATKDFEKKNQENLFQNTKRILYNWKKNPENNEKFLRKEFKYGQENKNFVDNRSLLGIKQHPK